MGNLLDGRRSDRGVRVGPDPCLDEGDGRAPAESTPPRPREARDASPREVVETRLPRASRNREGAGSAVGRAPGLESKGAGRSDMSGVRVLVGTSKGAFVLTSDGEARASWDVERPALRGLGDLPPEGLAGRPEPALRLAVEQLVRPGDPALRRRRRRPGSRSATSSPTTACPARTSGTTARRTPGSSRASGTSSRRSPIPTPSTPASRTPRCSARATAARPGRSSPGLRGHGSGPHVAAGRRRHVPAHDPARPDATRARIYHRDLVGGRVPHRRRAARPGGRSTAASCSEQIPNPTAEVGHCVHRIAHAPRRARTCCSCRSTGT